MRYYSKWLTLVLCIKERGFVGLWERQQLYSHHPLCVPVPPPLFFNQPSADHSHLHPNTDAQLLAAGQSSHLSVLFWLSGFPYFSVSFNPFLQKWRAHPQGVRGSLWLKKNCLNCECCLPGVSLRSWRLILPKEERWLRYVLYLVEYLPAHWVSSPVFLLLGSGWSSWMRITLRCFDRVIHLSTA